MSFHTKKKGYRFKDGAKAIIFKQHLNGLGFFGSQIRKSLPESRGMVEPGYTVWIKARTVADELAISQLYKKGEN